MATWELRVGAPLCCAWALPVVAEWGCLCPTLPHRVPAPQYFILLLIIFLLEIIAGVLAYVYYQQVRVQIGPVGTRTQAHMDRHMHRQGVHIQGYMHINWKGHRHAQT